MINQPVKFYGKLLSDIQLRNNVGIEIYTAFKTIKYCLFGNYIRTLRESIRARSVD